MKKAFTLAEIMIVLTIIAVLTAILLPVARHSMPDKNLMLFKKGHNALHATITELVTSDKYYLDGDLGRKINGDDIDGTHDGDYTYLCETMADVLNTKSVKCVTDSTGNHGGWSPCWGSPYVPGETEFSIAIDEFCNGHQGYNMTDIRPGEGIITKDGIVFYETDVKKTFGSPYNNHHRYFDRPDANCGDGLDWTRIHKVICMDIDGVPNNTKGYWECGNECPFGYGVRIDGRILNGARANEWLKKEVNKK